MDTTTWYRCAVTCSGQTAYSTVKQVTLQNYANCYCTGSALGGGCESYTAIDSVAIENTTLANGLTGCSPNNYKRYPSSGNTTATLNRGSLYTLDTRFNGDVAACFWIDYNRNGILEGSEWRQICTQSPSIYDTATVNGVFTTQVDSLFRDTFTVPSNAKIGLTLMRVRSRASGNINDSTTACVPFASGETEDYYVNIDFTLGIKQLSLNNETIYVYPNPASSVVFVNVELLPERQIQTNLFTINGMLVAKSDSNYNGEPIRIDISSLEAGVYFLKISDKESEVTKKIIVTR